VLREERRRAIVELLQTDGRVLVRDPANTNDNPDDRWSAETHLLAKQT
jgi:hypothetical protein